MGIARGAIALLLEEAGKRPFHGRIATLGRQTVYTTAPEIARQFAKFGVAPRGNIPAKLEVLDTHLFAWLGFERVESLDYSDFEEATHVVDLNRDGLPEGLSGAFDVVLDSGTLEHVFHVPNALRNIADMAKVGGRIIFLSPSSNHMDHGFYMFSPTLFSDWFSANGFRLETQYVVRYSGNLDELWDAYAYEPGCWRDLHIGGLDDSPYAIFVVATRLPESRTDVIPQQGYYADNTAAYVGSRLAKSGTAPAPAPVIHVPQAVPQAAAVAAPPPVPPQDPLLRRLAKQVPGARPVYRRVMAALTRFLTKGVVPAQQPTHGIHRKPRARQY